MRVGVLFGGASCEHDISVITASQIMANLNEEKYEIIPLYLKKDGEIALTEKFKSQKDLAAKRIKFSEIEKNRFKGKKWANFKRKMKLDVMLPAIHGKFLEGGEVYGLCKTLNIAYPFSDCFASSVCMSKIKTKKLLKFMGLNYINYVSLNKHEFYDKFEFFKQKIDSLGYPLIIKADELGSSIGLYSVNDENELLEGLNKAFEYDENVLIERKLSNFLEFNCAYLKTNDKKIVSDVSLVTNESDVYTFEKKYQSSGLNYVLPAPISIELEEEIKDITVNVCEEINAFGVLRLDYLYDLDNNLLYLNEINSIPGSYAYYLFENKGIYFDDLLDLLVESAVKRKFIENNFVNEYKTNVLEYKNK